MARKVEVEEGLEYLGLFFNSNFVFNHMKHFEKKLKKEIDPHKNIKIPAHSECPNFAAWLRLYAEYICNDAYRRMHRAKGNWKKIGKISYQKLSDELKICIEENEKKGLIKEKIPKVTLNQMLLNFKKVIELRHTIQHSGIPNIERELRFPDEINKNDIYQMVIPQNYLNTMSIFESAHQLLKMLPQPIIKVYKKGFIMPVHIKSGRD